MDKTQQHTWEWEVSRIACHNIARSVLALDVSDVCISDELQQRVEDLLAKEKTVARKRSIRRRVITILVAAVLLTLTACMSIPTVREKLYKIVVTYYDGFFSYKSEPIETDEVTQSIIGEESSSVTETQEAITTEPVAPVFEKRLPTYLPEGYEVIGETLMSGLICVDYGNFLDGTMICYEQSAIGTKTYKINSENAQIEDVSIHGNAGIMARKAAEGFTEITLVWNDGVYDYSLNTVLIPEEALKIAESIR